MIRTLIFCLLILTATSIFPAKQPSLSREDVRWLTKNVYFEARDQPIAGQIAVIMVTLNRVKNSAYPNSIKAVITQGGTKLNKCQFSWYCDGKPDVINDWKTFWKIEKLVMQVLHTKGLTRDITSGAIFYHADYVKPHWAKHKKRIVKIDKHIFYR